MFQDSLIDSIKPLRGLTYLRLIFHYDIESVPGHTRVHLDQLQAGFVENMVQEEDLHPAAIRLVDALQSLQYLFLATCGKRRYEGPESWEYWYSPKAWTMPVGGVDEDRHPAGGSRPCVEIAGEEAEAVIDAEELHLRQREEVGDFHSRTAGCWKLTRQV